MTYKLTDEGKKELIRLEEILPEKTGDYSNPDGAMHSVLMMLNGECRYSNKKEMLEDVDDYSNDPGVEIPAMSKAFDKALKDNLIIDCE